MGRRGALAACGLFLSLSLMGYPVAAAGFSFDQQGARAIGMAGAFTAQADDPSAVFYNPAGLALPTSEGKRKKLAVGAASYNLGEGLFQGLAPGVGAGTNGEQENPALVAGHAYLAQPISPRVTVGLGVGSPFLMETKWREPDLFAGRFISFRSKIDALDLNPVVSCRWGQSFGVGLGLVYRSASFELERRLPSADALGNVVDVASFRVDTGTEDAFGWNAGLLQRVNDRFSWGLTYRSPVTVDFVAGEGRLTQIPTGDQQLDDLTGATLPFDEELPFVSSIEFPATASLGFALGLGRGSLVELDVDWTGWSTIEELPVDFPTEPDLTFSIPERFDDTFTYRLGYRYRTRTGTEWRLGYAFDETPQPSATVGPFFADADRNVVAAGVGRGWLDVAVAWTDFDQRIVTDSATSFNGNYRSNAWLVAVTISH